MPSDWEGRPWLCQPFGVYRIPEMVQDTGYLVPDTEYLVPDTGYLVPDTGCRIAPNCAPIS